jgi:hypothetical protein
MLTICFFIFFLPKISAVFQPICTKFMNLYSCVSLKKWRFMKSRKAGHDEQKVDNIFSRTVAFSLVMTKRLEHLKNTFSVYLPVYWLSEMYLRKSKTQLFFNQYGKSGKSNFRGDYHSKHVLRDNRRNGLCLKK